MSCNAPHCGVRGALHGCEKTGRKPPLCTAHCALRIVHCELCIVNCALCFMHFALKKKARGFLLELSLGGDYLRLPMPLTTGAVGLRALFLAMGRRRRETKKRGGSDCSESPLLGGDYLLSHFRSTIGVVRLNFSVRNGKRWDPHAIITLMSSGLSGTQPLNCALRIMNCASLKAGNALRP